MKEFTVQVIIHADEGWQHESIKESVFSCDKDTLIQSLMSPHVGDNIKIMTNEGVLMVPKDRIKCVNIIVEEVLEDTQILE